MENFQSTMMDQYFNHDPRFDEFTLNFRIDHDEPINMEALQDMSFDASSNHSSYKGLNKSSPDYVPSSDFEGSDRLNEEDSRGGKSPRLIKKAIQKLYEPVEDNGILYRYEEDPNEYKKARKRIQNRISATRVRNKKKTYVEELEIEIAALKETNTDLRTKNNILVTENTVLKQQISFFERLVMKTPKSPVEFESSPQTTDDVQIELESVKDECQVYTRVNSSSRIKKHAAFLTVLTVLLCVYGIWTENDALCLSMVSGQMLGGKNQLHAFSINKNGLKGYDGQQEANMDGLANQTTQIDAFSMLLVALKMAILTAYVLYAVSFSFKLQRHYQPRSLNAELDTQLRSV